jgi:RNA polymerase sigma-70 factor (ECF subfamily)
MDKPSIQLTASDDSEASNQLQEFVARLTESQGRIRAFIVSLMPGSPDVSDVLQETNLVLWQSRNRFKPGTNFLAWAFTIARLEVLHNRGRAKRNGHIVLSPELLDMIAEELSDTEDHEAYLNALETCKSKLPDKQRELIEIRYQPGRSLEEFAEKTGRKGSALRVALLRIRVALRKCVEQSLNQHCA